MKNKLIMSLFFICLINVLFAVEPMRDPFVLLIVDGVQYKDGDRIEVRAGEKIFVEAIIQGGRRDYCSNPQVYANIGQNTVIESQGEKGMSFNINSGQFRGTWKLLKEHAQFTSAEYVKIASGTSTPGGIQRTAFVEIDHNYYSEVFMKVNMSADWHYVRHTPGGVREENETNTAVASFTFVIMKDEGVWFTSNNLSVKGEENFSVRNNLHDIQKFYDLIEKCLLEKNLNCAEMHFNNLKTTIQNLNTSIDRAKKDNPGFECEVTFIGLPSDLPLEHIMKIEKASKQWKDMYSISQENAQKINEILLNTQLTFSANIMKSIVKNYIDWGSGLPTGVMDMITMHDPNNVFKTVSLPGKILDWYTQASEDAGILKNQANNIKLLSELREYYLSRMENAVVEMKEFNKIIVELRPVQNLHDTMKSFFRNNPPHTYKPKNPAVGESF